MRRYFIDTFYLVALSNRHDQWHRRFRSFSQTLTTYHLYTVEEVLAEYLTFCSASRPHIREEAAWTVRNVLRDPHVTVIPQSHTSFLDALAFYESRLDKQYSLTDCVAMQAMQRGELTDVLSNDHHFTQEGFHIVFV
jgi:predicted nucleic acid-binding protein